MKVIGKEIGGALDELYEELQSRARIEAERELQVKAFEGESISDVRWTEETVTISLHRGVPTHALPHVFGVALHHVRQRLDLYPDVRRPAGEQPPEGSLLRVALRELVLAPEAHMQLSALKLDREWESEQRHSALKELLRDLPPEWEQEDSPGSKFMALQYAGFAVQHPDEMWEGLRENFAERLPGAAERGEAVLKAVHRTGWGTQGACLQSLVSARDELELATVALVEDRRSGEVM